MVDVNSLIDDFGTLEKCDVCGCIPIDGQCRCSTAPKLDNFMKAKAVQASQAQARAAAEAEAAKLATAPLNQPAASQSTQSEVEAPKEVSVVEFLKQIPGAPTEDNITAWKSMHGKVYSICFSPDDIYIWRPIKRREYQQMMAAIQAAKAQNSEEMLKEQIVTRTVLWPQMDLIRMNTCPAGLVDTLFGVIMLGSYFISADSAMSLVQEM